MNAEALHAMVPRPCRVRRVLPESYDTFTLELEPHAGGTFAPGQFNMLYRFGVGEVPISISGDPTRQDRLVHTTRQVGAVTRALGTLRRGDSVGVRGPFGRPWPIERACGRDLVMVAGGIGLAPLRPVLYDVLSHRQDVGRVSVLYGARSPEDILYRREFEGWREQGIEVAVTVDRAGVAWPGHVGVVTSLIAHAAFDPANALAFVCGPEVMMRFAAVALQQRGVADDAICVSLERNMKCAIGVCGHCQFGPSFVCKDGPVFAYARVKRLLDLREI